MGSDANVVTSDNKLFHTLLVAWHSSWT